MTTGPTTALALLAVVAVTLSGCTRPTTPTPLPQPRPPAIVNKTALAGQTIRIDFIASINPDCSVRAVPTVRIVDPPANGTTQIKEVEDFTTYPTANPRSACNKAKSPGVELTYTPNPGYLGSDYLTYETITADGYDRTLKIALTVK